MQRAPLVLRGAASVLRTQSRNYGGHGFMSPKELTETMKNSMEHLPKPSGSWQEGYRAKDSKANIFFATSVAVFAASMFVMEKQGCFDMLQNPAYWSDKQVERQARYYAKGDRFRVKDDDDE